MFRHYCVAVVFFFICVGGVRGAGNVSFTTDTTAVAPTTTGRGYVRAKLLPVTPAEAESAMRARLAPADLSKGASAINLGKGAPAVTRALTVTSSSGAPASIPELARALRNSPDLIYEYVRNNIGYYPIWGVQKGAFGALMDRQGTAFDQSMLMVALLRQAGYSASYVSGGINLSAAQARDWLGVDTTKVCAIGNLLANGQIPIASMTASAAGSCPGSATAELLGMRISHVWVTVNIGGTNYVFDPSFKSHAIKPGIDLAAATGYNATNYLATARSGATTTADYVQKINRNGIRNTLTTYANNLASYLRSNQPAARLDDVIGGLTIIPYSGGSVRQTSLPYQDTSVAPTIWSDIPAAYSPTLRVQHAGIDRTYGSDAIYGKRLTITYNASNQPVLSLDGVLQATGTAVAPASIGSVAFSVTHGAYARANANQSFVQSIKAGGTYLIGNGWGPAGRGLVDYHRSRLEAAKAAGNSDTSEPVMGSGLAVLSMAWISQANSANAIIDSIARTTTLLHHQVGIAGFDKASYVDLPGNMVGIVSQTGDAASEIAAYYSASMHSSIFESTTVQQTTGVSAVSTVKLIDIAVTNNDKIFDARRANYAGVVRPSLTSCAASLNAFQTAVNADHRLILPARCNLAEDKWTGAGYFDIDTGSSVRSFGAVIGGGLAGGFSTSGQLSGAFTKNVVANAVSPSGNQQTTQRTFADPIDMSKGHYLYQRSDFSVGVGEFPYSLSFQRLYSSGRRLEAGRLGLGWTHNFAASASAGSDGYQGMGEDSALDAVGAIVENMVSLDLMADAAKPLDKMVIATLGQRWFGDQLLNNTVIVRQGLNGEVFVKLPDGSYNAPPGSAIRLTRNADGGYTEETAQRVKINFDAAGRLASYLHPSGARVGFSYSGNDLVQVRNSLGRTLTLTNSAGRVTAVADGNGRSVKYGYAATGNLASFTDATAKTTTFQYDLPGRLTRLFYPSNPGVPFVSNVYDSLGRVQTQTDANGKLYTYYFAGLRSEEVGPGNISRVSHLDGDGRVTREISPVGGVTVNSYDGHGRLTRSVLPEGNAVQYTYDDATCASAEKRCTHNVRSVIRLPKPSSPLAPLTSAFTYEPAFNQIATSTDARQQVTSYSYTARGEPLAVSGPPDPAGVRPGTSYAYTAFSPIFTPAGYPTFYLLGARTDKISATSSVTTSYGYSVLGKYAPSKVTRDAGAGALNLVTSFGYDIVGNQTWVNGPRGDVADTRYIAYDAERRPVQTTNALGKRNRIAYDADGRPLRVAAQAGAQWLVSCRTYSFSGKPLRSWGPALTAADTACPVAAAPVPVTDHAYDDRDRVARVTRGLTSAEGGNRVSETDYNADDSVRALRRGVGTPRAQTYAAYTYTANGQLATVRDANNNLTTHHYDGHDRREKTFYPDMVNGVLSSTTDFEQYGYDANGNLTGERRRDGQGVANVYDNLNRLVGRQYPAAADNVGFAHDLLGRRTAANLAGFATSHSYDNAGRLSATTSGGRTLTYQYDAAGNRKRVTWPDGFYVTYDYDALNRPIAIRENGGASLAGPYVYDDLSRRVKVTLGNKTGTAYNYDNQSTLNALAQNLAGGAQDVAFGYLRNQAGEIVSHTWNNDLYQWKGYANGARAATVNGLNQYSAVAGVALGHDANGNLAGDGVWSYGYDLDNRLRGAVRGGLTAALSYDGAGRLRETTIASVTTRLLYDGADLVAEYDAAGKLLRRYVHGPGVDEPLVWYEGAGSAGKSWLYADHLGSVIATADAAGVATSILSYGPYGEPNQGAGVRFRYTGQQLLGQLNLYYYKARMYSPALGRFLQTDPIGYADDLNLYAYVGNNSINRIDPWGLGSARPGSGSFVTKLLPDGAPIVRLGEALGGVAAAVVGYATGDTNLLNAAVDGLSTTRQENVELLGLTLSMGRGRGASGASAMNKAPDFVVSPNGTVFPVPVGAMGPVPVVNSGGKITGVAYTGGSGGGNGNVSTMRIMEPTPPRGASPGYPNGYIKYENTASPTPQGVDPYSGKTLPNSQSHFPVE